MRSPEPTYRASDFLAIAALIFSLTPAAARAADAPPPSPKRVLILYDENTDFSGLAILDDSIKATLKTGMPAGLEIYTEYMDVSRFHEPGYAATLRDFFRRKYAGRRIDVVMPVMSPAFEFALEHGATTWPGAAVVFCGIDDRELTGRPLGP